MVRETARIPPVKTSTVSSIHQATYVCTTSVIFLLAVNSVDDFCVFAPPYSGANATIGDTERIEVSWCIKAGYGTRLIPDGAISGAHFVQTPDYVQVTGVGNLTLLNIPAGDTGGELDPHGADGNGELISNWISNLGNNCIVGQVIPLAAWYLRLHSVKRSKYTNGPTSCPQTSSASEVVSRKLRHRLCASTFMM